MFSFLVGLSPDDPIRPDAEHVIVHVPEDDSTAGAIRAGVLAAQIAGVSCAMVTSTELLAAEL